MAAEVSTAYKGLIQVFIETITINRYNINGRASRREFWFFHIVLYTALLFLYLSGRIIYKQYILIATYQTDIYFIIAICALCTGFIFLVIFPLFCLRIRRLHDMNLTGLIIVAYFVPYVSVVLDFAFFFKAGTKGPNSYGPSPYETTNDTQQTQQETIKTESIPVEEVLFNNKTGKTAEENIETKKPEEPINLFDPNKPSYKV